MDLMKHQKLYCPAGWGAADGSGKRRLAAVTGAQAAAATELNATWLEDCVIRLMCVLALDRFGDFVSDQVRCFVSLNPRTWETATPTPQTQLYILVVLLFNNPPSIPTLTPVEAKWRWADFATASSTCTCEICVSLIV